MAIVLESAPRAVGQALRRNPFCPVVPCHRVVAADLNIGGFSGGWGISDPKVQRKRRLLEEEGVGFQDDCGAAEGTCRVLKQFVLGPEELRGLRPGQQQPCALKAGQVPVQAAAAGAGAGAGGSMEENEEAVGVGVGAGGVKGRKKKRV
ncbi:hypothetical protein HXX76_000097 [Chlamydomonas incerta]|uniref:Methylated-DNA--protein-cysteine methyltransferase n=1 Tax=Chlamydomonas incerta TaxID=51695 RepID=A0A835WDN3_CHLIN|nr:hypothetical protein HXX76_000097 [Chlamydomonas incerta]|eukprot:KAG2445481.1 hypothetical protein HXX76_000097 [Chlamydomonas incerta]